MQNFTQYAVQTQRFVSI